MHATTCWPLLLITKKYRALSTYLSVLCFEIPMPLTFSGMAILSILALGNWVLSQSQSTSVTPHPISMQPLRFELTASWALIQFASMGGVSA